MAYIADYWKQKEERAKKAKEHTKEVGNVFSKFIEKTILNTFTYSTYFKCSKSRPNVSTNIVVEDMDSVSAIFKYKPKTLNEKIAVLNFASYKNPGGQFLNGSSAQEESLCHESFLYNVLSECKDYYEWNNLNKNKGLYLNRALYSPVVAFMRPIPHEPVTEDSNIVTHLYASCDVITCAAPNRYAAQKYLNVSDAENFAALKSRVKYVLDIAKENEVDILILGAWGCGVFGQDPADVANLFRHYLTTTHKCFKTVVFAVPKGNNANYSEFKKVFCS